MIVELRIINNHFHDNDTVFVFNNREISYDEVLEY